MDNVNKTLYIPLYGKAFVSAKGILLRDPKAEEIWNAEGFPLKGKSRSKWLAYYMSIRARVFDRWLEEQMATAPDTVILHLGCGMDSRITRVGDRRHSWYDVDFPDVIKERKRYFGETETYKMLASDICDQDWLKEIPRGNAIVVMEGISMYLEPEKLRAVLGQITEHFSPVKLLMDCYSSFAAKASRFKNPINDVGVTQVYGLDDPRCLENAVLKFAGEREMTPIILIEELTGMEKAIFTKLYAGKAAKRMYRLYEFTT